MEQANTPVESNQQSSQPQQATQATPNQSAEKQHLNPVERAMANLRSKYNLDTDSQPSKKVGQIADELAAKETKLVPQAKTESVEATEEATEEPKEIKKRKLKVDGKEIELDEETIERYAQKGISLEKRRIEVVKQQRAIEAKAAEVEKMRQQSEFLVQALAQNPAEVLAELFGPEKAFEALKPWLAETIQKEQQYEQNPQLRQMEQLKRENELLRQKYEQEQQVLQQQALSKQEQEASQYYQNLITEALSSGDGFPKTDFTAAEMAGYIKRALQGGIEYTPQQLAQVVKEDNIVRVRSLVDNITRGISEAQKSGDADSIVKLGNQLVDILGDEVVYALGKYHVSKLNKTRNAIPKTQVLETPKTKEEPKEQGYMDWDEYQDQVRARFEKARKGEQLGSW